MNFKPVEHSSRSLAGVCVLVVLAAGACFGAEQTKVFLEQKFGSLRENFGKNRPEKAKVESGPREVKMLRGGSPGKSWQVSLGGVKFRVTIEDKISLDLTNVLARLQQLPPPYRRAFAIVSEGKKDGVAFYQDLDGAAAHGSQDYLNLVRDANACVIAHESGHILEQRARVSDPKILEKWKAAVEKDGVSVSGYGDSANHEDLAEFAFVYALCADADKEQLDALKKLSPGRSAIWEEILEKNNRGAAWD